jgi:antitoxin component YwqK of YwqJK toxin-antitoxin module
MIHLLVILLLGITILFSGKIGTKLILNIASGEYVIFVQNILQMKWVKMILLFCVLFQSNTIFAQPFDTIRVNQGDGFELLQIMGNNNIIAEGLMKNKLKEGTWNSYWETGFPQEITTFHKGKKNGFYIKTGADGFIEKMIAYKDDELNGPSRIYNKGAFIMEEIYYVRNKKNGSYIKWYINGIKQEQCNYLNDARDGLTTWYYENGKKAAEYHYKNGKLEGKVVNYNEQGKMTEQGQYKGDEQTGIWKEYYDNEQLKAEGIYVNGEKEGLWKRFDEKGKTLTPQKYQKGTLIQ